jgi:hypothetical protein
MDNLSMQGQYGPIITRLAEEINNSETLFDYWTKAMSILYNTTFASFLIILIAIHHIIQVYIGVKNLDNCPIEPRIPVYLFIGGCIGTLKCLHLISKKHKKNRFNDSNSVGDLQDELTSIDEETLDNLENKRVSIMHGSKYTNVILNIFLIVWFIFGNIWILSVYKPRYEQYLYEPSKFCYKSVYVISLSNLFVYYFIFIFLTLFFLFITLLTQLPCLIIKFQEC